jgi:hypothetical protein
MTWRGPTRASRTRRASAAGGQHGKRGRSDLENSIGAAEPVAVRKDPAFDPALRAFYYARAIEIRAPGWTAYDAKCFR